MADSKVTGLPAALAAVPYGVLRPQDARAIYGAPGPEFARLAERGVLRKVATGYYGVVPPGSRARHWLASIEAVAFGVAAADYGEDAVTLMGLSAARLWGAVPRALAVAIVAIPKQRPVVQLRDRRGHVIFVRRDTAGLASERVGTDLGSALVTTVDQTVLDLAHRPGLGGLPAQSKAAVRQLWARTTPGELERIAGQQRKGAALTRARAWAAE